MVTRRSTAATSTLITGAAATLAATVVATTSPSAHAAPGPQEVSTRHTASAKPDPRAPQTLPSQAEIDRAMREARALAQSQSQSRKADGLTRQSAPAAGEPAAATALQDSIDTLVKNGAVGVTARIDSPSLTWSGASGTQDLAGTTTANPGDRFRAASNTKMMIATLVMQEFERGRWTLDTSANSVVPGLFPGRDVTIEQLLSHTSGAPDGLGDLLASRMENGSWAAFVKAMGEDYTDEQFLDVGNQLPWTAPGSFAYSNAGYVALGVMLEEATGQRVADLMRRRIFQPAGMTHSTYAVKPGVRGPFLHDVAFTPEGPFSLDHFNPRLFSAAGALVSTAPDLNRFTDPLMDGRLVSKTTVNDMRTVRTSETNSLPYGLGLMRLPDPCTPQGGEPRYVYGHNGGSFGTISWGLSNPEGARQVSIATTGRYYSDNPAQGQPFDQMTTLLTLMAASC